MSHKERKTKTDKIKLYQTKVLEIWTPDEVSSYLFSKLKRTNTGKNFRHTRKYGTNFTRRLRSILCAFMNPMLLTISNQN